MHTFIIRDVRLAGWKPEGDVIEVNSDTPLPYVIDSINERSAKHGKDLKVIIMCHGLPGWLQCANGTALHPTAGNGITINDLGWFAKISGNLRRLEFHACLVARVGNCHECNGHQGYDGNAFCFKMAQTIGAEVKASIHVQWFNDGTYPGGAPTGKGIDFQWWNGRVFTWDKTGTIIKTDDFPYKESRNTLYRSRQ